MRLRSLFFHLLAALSACAMLSAQQMHISAQGEERAALHRSSEWQLVAPHLPDPTTASAAALELAGDVLKARRFPDDALEYYQYAVKRGGDNIELMEKMGVVRLQMQQTLPARDLFQRCVHQTKNNARAWNNLGAADYMLGAYARAITEYKRAVKLNKRSAVFHANLGMAYLTSDHIDGARTEFRTALELDPSVLDHHPDGGATLRALEAKDFSKLCFETARAYIERNQMEQAKVWLQRAGENGIDLRVAMDDDRNLRPLLKDPDIRMLIANTEAFRKRLALDSAPILPMSNRSQSFPE